MKKKSKNSLSVFVKRTGDKKSKVRLVWLHGWGHSHKSFIPLSSMFSGFENLVFDLPGFGDSDNPDSDWTTEDYAVNLESFLSKEPAKKTYIIGHSFGCRVSLRYANKFPKKLDGLVFIGGAGLKKRRSIYFKFCAFILKSLGKTARLIDGILNTKLKEKYSKRFGSADYKKLTGVMKGVFIKAISEDLSTIAPLVQTQTLLIYGEKDIETPPSFGLHYNKMLKNSVYFELPNFNHNTVLSTGRHQVYNIISDFLSEQN